MKKILVAFNATKLDEEAMQYAMHFAKNCNGLLVGVLLHDLRFSNYVYGYAWDQPVIDYTAIEAERELGKEKIKSTIEHFESLCKENGVHHKIHIDKGIPLDELLHETAFADFLVVSSEMSFFNFASDSSKVFLKDVLHDSHCPVVIVPKDWVPIQKVILCYDGYPSSIYAIKMFSYSFPHLADTPTTVVTVNENSGNHLADNSNIKDLLHRHFSNLATEVLHGLPDVELIKYIKRHSHNTLVVMGAYGRSSVSRFFHHSISNPIIMNLKMPVFIAHQ